MRYTMQNKENRSVTVNSWSQASTASRNLSTRTS